MESIESWKCTYQQLTGTSSCSIKAVVKTEPENLPSTSRGFITEEVTCNKSSIVSNQYSYDVSIFYLLI